jgi:UDP-glucose 4-epimerase
MRVLVTGGLGFIGTYVCETLKGLDHEPVVIDRKAGADIFGDIRDSSAVSEAIYETDGFIHVAGVLGTQETLRNPDAAVETNIVGGLNIFKAARDYSRPGVYIAVGNHWMNNPYSISKTTAERFAFMANAEWGTRIAVVRALNAYGPRQKVAPVRKIMPTFITAALRGDPIVVYGDGEQVMDCVYVNDVARVLVRALLVDHGVYDSVFEAGTGRPTTVNEIAEAVIAEVGSGTVEHAPMRPGEPGNSVVLGNPLTLEPLGPLGLTKLEDRLKPTVAYYR